MTTYTTPVALGNAFGPGTQVVTCQGCGAIVLPESTELHTAWHDELDGTR